MLELPLIVVNENGTSSDDFKLVALDHDGGVFINSNAEQFRMRLDHPNHVELAIADQNMDVDRHIFQQPKSAPPFGLRQFAPFEFLIRVPADIHKEVATRVQREVESGMTQRSDRLIDYTNFGELSVIITSNWDLFKPVLTNPRAVTRVMNNLNLLRGPIAHCCPISEDEIERLRLSVKDWFRTMGSSA